jgi:hypothetical protein
VLQHGLIRRVVNEDDTAIWGDRWISDHFDARPITPRVEGHSNQVSELLTDSGVGVSSMQDDVESKGAELAKQRSAGFQI